MSKVNCKAKKFLCLIFELLIIFGSMNLVILSSSTALAEGGSPEIHLDELGFSTEFTSTPSTTLYCPRFEQSTDWETQIVINNPSENGANINVYYYTPSGVLINNINEFIEPTDYFDFISTDHNINEESGSILISSDVPIFGNVIYYSSYCAAAEPLQTSHSSKLYCPGFYQSDSWDTWICINNVDESSTDVTLTYYNEEGTEIDSVSDTLSPNELRYFQPSDDGIEANFGSVIIESAMVGD